MKAMTRTKTLLAAALTALALAGCSNTPTEGGEPVLRTISYKGHPLTCIAMVTYGGFETLDCDFVEWHAKYDPKPVVP